MARAGRAVHGNADGHPGRRVLGFSPLEAGLGLLPTAVMIAALSVGASARLNTRFGAQKMLVGGLIPLGLGLGLLLRLPDGPVPGAYPAYVLPTFLLTGGFGLALPAMITLAMSGASASGSAGDAGVTSGLVNTTQQVGTAILSTLAASASAGASAHGAPSGAALASGYHLAFGTGTGFVVAAVTVAVTGFGLARRRPQRAAAAVEHKALPERTGSDRKGR